MVELLATQGFVKLIQWNFHLETILRLLLFFILVVFFKVQVCLLRTHSKHIQSDPLPQPALGSSELETQEAGN